MGGMQGHMRERFLMRGCEALGQLGHDGPWPSWFVDHATDNGSPPTSGFTIDTSVDDFFTHHAKPVLNATDAE